MKDQNHDKAAKLTTTLRTKKEAKLSFFLFCYFNEADRQVSQGK